MAKPLSVEQLRVLAVYADGGGPGEAWSQKLTNVTDSLAWYRHERTLASLEKRGLINANGITEAGCAEISRRGAA